MAVRIERRSWTGMARLIQAVTIAVVLAVPLRAGHAEPPAPVGAAPDPSGTENLTVTGHRQKFERAPMPGAPLPPPPDKPPLQLGHYKISGDQEQHDGVDSQTGAQIGGFGTAYTGASPVSQGLAPNHPN